MDLISLFIELVKIPSPSKSEGRIVQYIKQFINQKIEKGFDLSIIEDETGKKIGGDAGNLIVHLPGDGPQILFDAHLDTVSPCHHIHPIIENGVIRTDGTTVLGGDDKSGVAIMLALIEKILEEKIPHPPITFLFTVSEEENLLGAKHVSDRILDEASCIFVLDGEGPIGTVVTRTPYTYKGSLTVIGKEAHAGVAPEKGINALVVAAKAINQLNFGRIDEETTSNIGIVSGGTASNVVLGELTLTFEARSLDREKLLSYIQTVKKVFQRTCDKEGAIFRENLHEGTPGYTMTDTSMTYRSIETVCKKMGVIFSTVSCGGGSNANVYRAKGHDAINISTNMQKIHSTSECIKVADLEKGLQLALMLVNEFVAIK